MPIELPDIASDVVLLMLRVIVGVSFIVAARNKSRNVRKFAKANGLPLAAGYVVTALEAAAGTLLLLGLFPQLAAALVVLLMLGTIRLHIFTWRSPYWAAKGGWEYDLMLLAMASVIVVSGGGAFAVMELLQV